MLSARRPVRYNARVEFFPRSPLVPPTVERPNILVILSDEHAPQTLGCMGAGFARTPNIDRLAAGGATFDAAYCNFALCVPSRASLISGLLCHRINQWDIASPLGSEIPTWAHMARRAGYRAVANGKMHFIGPDCWHGFSEHINDGQHKVGGFRRGEENPDRTGYRAWSEVQITPDAEFRCRDQDIKNDAVAFLNEQPHYQPFCMILGFNWPHYPMRVTQSAWDLYEGVEIPDPLPREQMAPRNVHWSDRVWGFDRFTPEQTRDARRAYLAMVSMLDGWVGEVLDALEASGQAENTLVVYTSDHGDMWGEHGLWGKNLFYEESARVPLIFNGPALGVAEGLRVATPVSLVDLHPTFRDVIGAEDWNPLLDGRSLWDGCRGLATLDEQPVFCDYYACDTVGPERMIRYGPYKLNYYHRQGKELFNLADDPHEMTNLIDRPEMNAYCSRCTPLAA